MLSPRRIALVSVALGASVFSSAQLDGPVPLAWRWSGSTTVSPSGVPAFMGDNVYVGVGGRVYALDRNLGNKKWQWPLIEPITGNFTSSPVLSNNLLLAAGSNKTLYGIDATTGEQKWMYNAPGAIVGAPVVSGNFIAMNIDGNSIMAIGMDGKPVFENPERIFDGIMGDLVANGTSVIYTNARYQVFNLNLATRQSNRVATLQSLGGYYKPMLSGTTLFLSSGSYLLAMNPNGGLKWQRDLGETAYFSPAVSAEGIAAVTESGKVFLFDGNGTARRNSKGAPMIVDIASRPVAPPSAVGKMFAVPTVNGAVNLIDPVKGEVVWSYVIRPLTAGLKVTGSSGAATDPNTLVAIPAAGAAVLNGNTMYVLAADGSLLAFDKELGVDLTGPDISMLWPQQGIQTGTASDRGPLEVFFRVSDEATGVNPKTVSVKLDGKDMQWEMYRDGTIAMKIGLNEKNKPLPDGRATFEVSASDWMGNRSTTKFSITVDNTLATVGRPANTNPQGGGGVGGGGVGGGGRRGGGGGGK